MPLVDSETAALRLGVKLTTLYAYVSRGLLPSYPAPDPRRSLFDLDDIERLAARARGGRQIETRLATITTAITALSERSLTYRGIPVSELVGRRSFEQVAELLWDAPGGDWTASELPVVALGRSRDRVRLAVVLAAASDALRSDRRRDAVLRAARRLISSVVGFLPARSAVPPGPIAFQLAHRLGAPEVTPAVVAAVDAALILLADHELAASTLAVRIAASTRADVYDAVLSGLGCSGPLHLGASVQAHHLIAESSLRGAPSAFEQILASGSRPAGFGHAVYVEEDPRGVALLDYVEQVASPSAWDAVSSVVALGRTHGFGVANIDLALGALSFSIGAGDDAGVTLFSVARMSGWVAHYLEELQERGGRFRARALYAPARDPRPNETARRYDRS